MCGFGNTAIVRHSGSTAYADYTPLGQMIQSRSSGFNNEWFGYKGGRIDQTGTGLYRFGARNYDPNTNRWTSRDLIRNQLVNADAYGAFGNNPIINDDPSGLQSVPGNAGAGMPAKGPAADAAKDRAMRAEYQRLTGAASLEGNAQRGYRNWLATGQTFGSPILTRQTPQPILLGLPAMVPGRGNATLPFPINPDLVLTAQPRTIRFEGHTISYNSDWARATGRPYINFFSNRWEEAHNLVYQAIAAAVVRTGEQHPLARAVHGLILDTHGLSYTPQWMAEIRDLAKSLMAGGLQPGVPILWMGCEVGNHDRYTTSYAQALANALPSNPVWAEVPGNQEIYNGHNGVVYGAQVGVRYNESPSSITHGYPLYQLRGAQIAIDGGTLQMHTAQGASGEVVPSAANPQELVNALN